MTEKDGPLKLELNINLKLYLRCMYFKILYAYPFI